MESNRGKRYSPEERAEFVQLYKKSGQSLSRFCQEAGVTYASLKRWIDQSQEAQPVEDLETCPVSFLEVATTPTGSTQSEVMSRMPLPVRASFELRNGIRVRLDEQMTAPEMLTWIQHLNAC